jgi:hypothetical protein
VPEVLLSADSVPAVDADTEPGQRDEDETPLSADPVPAEVSGRHGEFDRPLAPPVTAAPLNQRPVAPVGAVGTPPAPPAPSLPGLPTRNPGSGLPDGGPDRLADSGAPSALEAALGGALPTRTRVGDPVPPVEEPASTTASRLDPEALRERLRAFQSEFRSGHEATDQPTATNHSNADLGGDR